MSEREWFDRLGRLERLAGEAETRSLPGAVENDTPSVAILRAARSAGALARLLRGVRRPAEGDVRILDSKEHALLSLLGGERAA